MTEPLRELPGEVISLRRDVELALLDNALGCPLVTGDPSCMSERFTLRRFNAGVVGGFGRGVGLLLFNDLSLSWSSLSRRPEKL